MAENERVLVEMVIAVDVDTVWASLRDPDRIGCWFGWDYDGLAAEIEQIFRDQAVADDDARTLAWSDGDRFELEAHDDGTLLRVLRRGHEGVEFDGAFDPIDEGWITFSQQLRYALERHPGQQRRTVSALGVDLGSDEDPLLARLGVRTLGDDPVGGAYQVEGPDGAHISGEVFFQTDLQVGLTVREENDALLVIARTPPSSAPPHGEAMFVLNTYGLDDDALAETARRWEAWWGDAEAAGSGTDADA